MNITRAVREVLNRVERREMQVDVALNRISDIYAGDFTDTPEDVIGQAAQSGPPGGTLSTYNAMEHNRADNGEGVPLSDDQLTELAAAEEAGDDDLAETLREEGDEVVEGADAVRAAIEDAATPTEEV